MNRKRLWVMTLSPIVLAVCLGLVMGVGAKDKEGKHKKKKNKTYAMVLCEGEEGDCRFVPMDKVSGAVPTISWEHYEIHQGRSFFASYDMSLDDSTVFEVLLEIPEEVEIHGSFLVTSSRGGSVQLFEGTGRTRGVVMDVFNRNRESDRVSGVTLSHGPGGAGDGMLLYSDQFGGLNFPGEGGLVARSRVDAEIIAEGKNYLLKIFSWTSGNRITLTMAWYEPEHH